MESLHVGQTVPDGDNAHGSNTGPLLQHIVIVNLLSSGTTDALNWKERRTADELKKGEDLAQTHERQPPNIFPTTAHRGGRIVKMTVPLILGVLLLSPALVKAAERKAAQGTPAVTAAAELPRKLDLNRVSLEELVAVPGIGPSMAQAIVDLRSKKGSFTRVEELLEVPGIKEKKLAAISGYLEIKLPRTSAATTPESPSR